MEYKELVMIKRCTLLICLLSTICSCSTIGGLDSKSKPKERYNFQLINLDKELITRVYDLKYVDAFDFFATIRPYLPREAILQVVSKKNMLVYSDQEHRLGSFEELLGFVDSEKFQKDSTSDNTIKNFGQLILNLRETPFYVSKDHAKYTGESYSNFMYTVSYGDPYDDTFAKHFDRWFGSCQKTLVKGRAHYSEDNEIMGKVVAIHVARSECVDKMSEFMSHLRSHDNTDQLEVLLRLDIKSSKSKIKGELKELFPTLYQWNTPKAIRRD